MNTNHVAKLLGVSKSTVKRWVKDLELEMERNDLGHYLFTEEKIELLKHVQKQIQNGVLLQDVVLPEQPIHPTTMPVDKKDQVIEKLLFKLNQMESTLNEKADAVVSYQLLQHRREIEELQSELKIMKERLEELESKQKPKKSPSTEQPLIFEQIVNKKKSKRKNLMSMLFNF
ncbi:MerR family transcriptional regulator [Peribacillus tepidiphilus]|uniref:MerR family transcriptional regulator n=1 Tax=Peribacillus tepidiphilus TaxID=2652445 RepID=UPI00129112AD|nr:MerR family transcriptional regulator [Peribacillus tepidiphilus]